MVDVYIKYFNELKFRALYIGFTICLIFILTFCYKETLLFILIPKGFTHFVSNQPTDIFYAYLRLCLFISVQSGVVMTILQVYYFVKPALYASEARKIRKILMQGAILYIFLFLFCGPYLIQISWELLYGYTKEFTTIQLNYEPQLNEYLYYLELIGLGLNFVVPFGLVFLRINNILLKILGTNHRRIIYILFCLIGALLSPPNFTTQIFVVSPIILLYESWRFILCMISNYNNKLKKK
ncbi:unnamed protein product [Choristocarpus tenellus]|uniref:SecY-independent transporter protein n=1 Tax=Choristocarpus tenellus TaxID=116065 RepID=UPI002E778CA9|nr:SecY-independent transporter protein [Choristocarpus tenellus]WBP69803.1 SecY-independent transporter protein [Choristocarpus tenellus]